MERVLRLTSFEEDRMDVQKDFADLCSLLNDRKVDYLVVGGCADAIRVCSRKCRR
jgi:hypothetical protein